MVFTAITNTIKDSYLGIPPPTGSSKIMVMNEKEAKKITGEIWNDIQVRQKTSSGLKDTAMFTGTYQDKWFGDVEISLKNGKLWFDSKRSCFLTGEMFPYRGSTFIVKWTERSLDADAFVQFDLDSDGKAVHMTMKPISPLTDFSFDFQDLYFTRN